MVCRKQTSDCGLALVSAPSDQTPTKPKQGCFTVATWHWGYEKVACERAGLLVWKLMKRKIEKEAAGFRHINKPNGVMSYWRGN
jgi:hypothetical protein